MTRYRIYTKCAGMTIYFQYVS